MIFMGFYVYLERIIIWIKLIVEYLELILYIRNLGIVKGMDIEVFIGFYIDVYRELEEFLLEDFRFYNIIG